MSEFSSFVKITVSEDAMKAYAELLSRPDEDETEFNIKAVAKELLQLIKQAGVINGLMMDHVSLHLEQWIKKNIYKKFQIAQGKEPLQGPSSRVDLVLKKDDPDFAPFVKSPTHDDAIKNIEKGTLLALKYKPSMGEKGYCVTQREQPALRGEDHDLEINELIECEEFDDRFEYRSLETAMLSIYTESKIELVHEVTIPSDVDAKTGNLNANGSVIIKGQVHPFFTVKAKDNITVRELVESAKLIAGGDIIIKGGLIGKSEYTYAECGGNFRSLYVDNAQVKAGGNIVIEDSVVNATLMAVGDINLNEKKGIVISSHLIAGGSVIVREAGTQTEVGFVFLSAGNDPLKWKQIKQLNKELNFLKRNAQKGFMDGHKMNNRSFQLKQRMRQSQKNRMMSILERTIKRRKRMMFEGLANEGTLPQITVQKKLYPKLKIGIGPFEKRIRVIKKGTLFKPNPQNDTLDQVSL